MELDSDSKAVPRILSSLSPQNCVEVGTGDLTRMHYLMFSVEVHPLIPEKYPYNSSLPVSWNVYLDVKV